MKWFISHLSASCIFMAIEIKWCPSWNLLYLEILAIVLSFIIAPVVGRLITLKTTILRIRLVTITLTTKTSFFHHLAHQISTHHIDNKNLVLSPSCASDQYPSHRQQKPRSFESCREHNNTKIWVFFDWDSCSMFNFHNTYPKAYLLPSWKNQLQFICTKIFQKMNNALILRMFAKQIYLRCWHSTCFSKWVFGYFLVFALLHKELWVFLL
jgi:hypothetical protein